MAWPGFISQSCRSPMSACQNAPVALNLIKRTEFALFQKKTAAPSTMAPQLSLSSEILPWTEKKCSFGPHDGSPLALPGHALAAWNPSGSCQIADRLHSSLPIPFIPGRLYPYSSTEIMSHPCAWQCHVQSRFSSTTVGCHPGHKLSYHRLHPRQFRPPYAGPPHAEPLHAEPPHAGPPHASGDSSSCWSVFSRRGLSPSSAEYNRWPCPRSRRHSSVPSFSLESRGFRPSFRTCAWRFGTLDSSWLTEPRWRETKGAVTGTRGSERKTRDGPSRTNVNTERAFTRLARSALSAGGKSEAPIEVGEVEPIRGAYGDYPPILWRHPRAEVAGRLMIVDGSAVLYRAYYKVQARMMYGNLEDFEADDDWAATVLSALSSMVQFLELQPTHVAICFDAKGMNFRHELFPAYKKNRAPTPDTVVQSLPYLTSALVAMGLTILEEFGVEADDVIGTLAVKGDEAGMEVMIASPDKDFFQVLSPRVRLLRPVSKGSGILSFGVEEFQQKYVGTQPSQFVDILALMGDQCDNVPGVLGIGEKTAPKLVRKFGSVENLLENLGSIGSDRLRKAMERGRESALLSKRLVKLQTDLPQFMVDHSWSSFAFVPPTDDGRKFWNLIDALEMGSVSAYKLRARVLAMWKDGGMNDAARPR